MKTITLVQMEKQGLRKGQAFAQSNKWQILYLKKDEPPLPNPQVPSCRTDMVRPTSHCELLGRMKSWVKYRNALSQSWFTGW